MMGISLLKVLRTVANTALCCAFVAGVKAQQVQSGTLLNNADKQVQYLSQPLINTIFTADPAVHIFNGRMYIYCSHDVETDKTGANGDHYDMKDYHVLSLPDINGKANDTGLSLSIENIPWANRQLWAPDAAYKKGNYYLFFPAKDSSGVFRIGVAKSKSPAGPFKAEAKPIKNSFSIDPCVFEDNGSFYMYFGGLSGGQLEQWTTGKFDPQKPMSNAGDESKPALAPKIAKLRGDLLEFTEEPKDVLIVNEQGQPLLAGDHQRRFFEAAWVFKKDKTYYFTYSTGDTHQLCYATGSNPYGPFIYKGVILKPVQGWTTHQSIITYQNKWYLFYHDTQLSGKNWLRNVKVTPLNFNRDGNIQTIEAMTTK